ncbi:hypothetical protein [Helicobacter sp. MIT 05-5294]|uniref:hypothetical protein n=1 Tax=Helicobacter sp. MIT 05-5294 TaxID=1548150 RepID=UPI00051FE46B|nr:hypothetical protein [Helicobacter sp. MIT 05-5294]TLD85809.1 hypothetical protein LS69_007895 [Helicobacter sp. MIT 05-5294]
MKNKVSEYIRLNYNEKQEVSTPLDFKSDITCKAATQDFNPVVFSQLDNLSSTIKQEILDALPTGAKPLERLEFNINGYNTRNATSGAVVGTIGSYAGVGGIAFMDKRGYPLECVGFTYGENYSSISIHNNFAANILGVKELYFAPQESEGYSNWTHRNLRLLHTPLTQEDQDYLEGLGREIICIKVEYDKNYLMTSSQNFYEWETPVCAFKTHAAVNALTAGTQVNLGLLTQASALGTFFLRFWIDDEESLNNFINNIIGVTFGTCFSGAINYGNLGYNFKMFKNNYCEINVDVENPSGRFYNFVNISENEANNSAEWDTAFLATYPQTANIGILNLGFKKRVIYNNTTKTYEVIE